MRLKTDWLPEGSVNWPSITPNSPNLQWYIIFCRLICDLIGNRDEAEISFADKSMTGSDNALNCSVRVAFPLVNSDESGEEPEPPPPPPTDHFS